MAPGALRRRERRLLINRDHDRVLRLRHREPAAIRGLGDELGILAFATLDLRAERSILLARKKRRTCCSCPSPGRSAMSPPSNAHGPRAAAHPISAGLLVIFTRRSRPLAVIRPGAPLAGMAPAPVAHRPRHRAKRAPSTGSRGPRPPTTQSARAEPAAAPSSAREPEPQAPRGPPAAAGLSPLRQSFPCRITHQIPVQAGASSLTKLITSC